MKINIGCSPKQKTHLQSWIVSHNIIISSQFDSTQTKVIRFSHYAPTIQLHAFEAGLGNVVQGMWQVVQETQLHVICPLRELYSHYWQEVKLVQGACRRPKKCSPRLCVMFMDTHQGKAGLWLSVALGCHPFW